MPVVVTLLRGVNVGSANRMKMDALRAVYESLGLLNPVTYLQSGNVLFSTAGGIKAGLTGHIESAIEQAFGFRPKVIARTAAELRRVVEQNPFAGRAGIDPAKLLVTFLAEEPAAESCEKLSHLESAPEEVRLIGREIYIYYPNGLARPKLPWTAIEKTLKIPGTGRNWNSVTKILELAGTLANIAGF